MPFSKSGLAARIRGRRAELDLTQEELADKAGVNKDTIFRYENETFMPSAESLNALAQALDTTPNYLLGWDDS